MSEENRPWDNDPNAGSFGAWLRRQREVREITLREISDESKISFRYLEALEQDRFEILPAPVFARGFLREYARFVGLDPDEVVNYYISAVPDEEPEEEDGRLIISQERRSSVWPVIGVLAVLLLVLLAFYWFSLRTPKNVAVPEIVPPTIESVGDLVEMVEPEAVDPIRMTLDFRQNSWVDVVVDGERQVSELRVQGESLRSSAQGEVRITLGNVAGVTLEVNEQPVAIGVGDKEEFVLNRESLSALGIELPDASGSSI